MGKAPWLEAAVVLAAVTAVAFAVLGWPKWEHAGWQTAAAWVQALGSVAAILATGYIARQQGLRAQQESERLSAAEASQHKAQLTSVADMIDRLQMTNSSTSKALDFHGDNSEGARHAALRKGPHAVAVEAIQKIPFHEIPYVYVAIDGLNFLNMTQHILEHLDVVARSGANFSGQENVPAMHASRKAIREHAEKADQFAKNVAEVAARYDGVDDPAYRLRKA